MSAITSPAARSTLLAGLAGPLVVRYACREWPDGNLYNAAGLPASPFLIGDVK